MSMILDSWSAHWPKKKFRGLRPRTPTNDILIKMKKMHITFFNKLIYYVINKKLIYNSLLKMLNY